MKSAVLWLLLCVGTLFGLTGGVAWGTCAGDENVAGEWIFEPVAEMPGWALNAGVDGDMGNLGLTGGATFSTNVPTVNGSCAHSLYLSWANTAAGAVSINDYDPLAGAEKFSILAWVRRDSAPGANLSARIFSDVDSTSLTNTTSGVEFRFSGNAGTLALRLNGTEVGTSVGGLSPTNAAWHHVAVVYDGTRAATNYSTRNVHFYVDGVQRGNGGILQNAVVATNHAPVVAGNASPSRTAAYLLAGHMDDLWVIPGWAPDAVGNGNANAALTCFMELSDDIFPPTLYAPPDVVTNSDDFLGSVIVELGQPITYDDCEVASCTNDAPERFTVGTHVVTWVARDTAGNKTTKFQTVLVEPSRERDSDNDGLTDYVEFIEIGTDPLDEDTDDDGLNDGKEVSLGTNPRQPDTDGDGLPDGWEIDNLLDPKDDGSIDVQNGADGDPDADGFPNLLEYELDGLAQYAPWSDKQLAYRLCHLQNGTNEPGLRVEIEDSANCGGTNDERQNVTAVLNVPDLLSWGVFLDITVAGDVEDQNAGYDKVSIEAFTNAFYFEGNENHHGCTMASKSRTCRVLVMANSQVILRYDTVGHLFHHGAFAAITNATVAGNIISRPLSNYLPNYWRTELGVGEELLLIITPDPGGVVKWQIGGNSPELGEGAEFLCYAQDTAGSQPITLVFDGRTATRTFQIFEPTGVVSATIAQTKPFPSDYAGAGMTLDPVVIGPTNVSFARVQYQRGSCAATNGTGYWSTNVPPPFEGDAASDWHPISFDNIMAPHPLEQTWDTPWQDLSMCAGHFEWIMPVKWRVGDLGAEHVFLDQVTEIDLEDNGQLSIRKYGRRVTRSIDGTIVTE